MSTRVPSTAFADAWIQVERTENPSFFIKVLEATRAQLLERARRSPANYFQTLEVRPGHRVLDAGCGDSAPCRTHRRASRKRQGLRSTPRY